MIKQLLVGLFFMFGLSALYSQTDKLDTQQARKSIVKIMVEVPGSTDASVCTGFVWKRKDWIVTSLHAMHPKGTVTVIYNSGDLATAKPIKVYEKADLVLLQVQDTTDVSSSVVALTKYDSTAIPRKTEMTAIGYGLGAKASRGNPLKRGDIATPENLERALPNDAVKKLKGYEIPDLKLDIIMLDGSLLPGFSGSPIFNDKTGEFIAIGEGGLENGTQALSWGIPAKYLALLEKSSNSSITKDFTGSPLHHSSAVKIAIEEQKTNNDEDPNIDVNAQLDFLAEQYTSIVYGNFEFFYVKTRTYAELTETSFDNENLYKLTDLFSSMKLHLDYSLFEFDIYEDPFNEVILVVPSGSELYVDENNHLKAKIDDMPMAWYFQLDFYYEPNNNQDWQSAFYSLQNKLDGEYPVLGGWQIDEEFDYSYELDEYTSMGWEMLYGEQPLLLETFDESGNLIYDENGYPIYDTLYYYSYVTLLTDKITDNRFSSNAMLTMPTIAFEYMTPDVVLDCVNNYDEEEDACNYFETWMKLVIASHMTSFSFVQLDAGYYEEDYYEEE